MNDSSAIIKLPIEEKKRLESLLFYENEAAKRGACRIAGVDEAGRGPLAGPVVAAACLIPPGLLIASINDSKKLTAKVRGHLFETLLSHEKIFHGVAVVGPEEIDEINIYQATLRAMSAAIKQLGSHMGRLPDYLLVDGLHLSCFDLPAQKIIRGDQLSQSIAAASIIAKETRDRLMIQFHELWPQYGFDRHKGYGTKKHIEAIERYGPCPIHRKSFEPIKTLCSNPQVFSC